MHPLLRFLFPKKNKIKYLSSELRSPIDGKQVKPEEVLMFMATAAKDRVGAQRVLSRYQVAAYDVVPLLPRPRGQSLKDRLLAKLRRIEGSRKYKDRDSRRYTRHRAIGETRYQPNMVKW